MIHQIPRSFGKISSASAIARLAQYILDKEDEVDREKEHFWEIGLDTRLFVKYVDLVTLGTLDSSLAHPREVYRQAIKNGVSRIAIMHNHPSGDPSPSELDKDITKRLRAAGEIVGIQLLDHVIVGNGSGLIATEAEYWAVREVADHELAIAEPKPVYVTPTLF